MVLNGVVQIWKEVDARHALNVIHTFAVVADVATARLVVEVEADGLPLPVALGEKYFVKPVGYGHVVGTDGLRIVRHNRAADDVQTSVFSCPITGFLLQRVPVALVEVVVLRTDVRQVETLLHGRLVPLHVAGGCHVAAVVPRARVVAEGRTNPVDGRVRVEMVGTVHVAVRFILGELVRHPVGDAPVGVVADRVTLMLDDLLGTRLRAARYLQSVGHVSRRLRYLRVGTLLGLAKGSHTRRGKQYDAGNDYQYQVEELLVFHFKRCKI